MTTSIINNISKLICFLLFCVFTLPSFAQKPFAFFKAPVVSDVPFSGTLLMDLNPSSLALGDGANADGVWQDSSTANNDMTLATGPTYQTSELNGYPAVRFDNVNDGGYSALNLTRPFTIYVLEKPVSNGLTRTVNSQSVNALISNGRSGLQGYLVAHVAGTSIPTLGKVTYAAMMVPATGTVSFFQDGRNITVGSPAAVADWGTVTLGYNGLFTEPADTDLYRVLIYSTAHTDAERLSVETYFTQRYNLKLVDEGFEGVGTPVRWYVSGASFDYATAPAPLVGTESLRLSTDGQYAGINAVLNHDELWGKFRVNVTTLPSSDFMELLKIQDVSEYTGVLSVYVNASGSIGTNSGTATTDVITAGTSYWIYWHYKHVAGSNLGTQEVAFSTTETRPSSGSKWTGDTTHTTGGRAVTFQFATSMGAAYIVDQVQVSTLPFD